MRHKIKAANSHFIEAFIWVDPLYYGDAIFMYAFGGRGEIRTHGGLSSSPVFKTGAFNRSATLPFAIQALDYK